MPLDYSNILRREQKLLNNIENAAINLGRIIRNTEQFHNNINSSNVLDKIAFLYTVSYINKLAYKYIVVEVQKALAITKEYNYSLYLQRIRQALEAHKDEIFYITTDPESNSISVNVSFESLGDVSLWASAVNAERKSRANLRRNKNEPSPELSSKMWAEKIYGSAREGKPVYKRRWNKKEKVYEQIDVTDQFKTKYRQTIRRRLANISPDKAPFFQLILFGNAPGSMPGSDRGGEPYPQLRFRRVDSRASSAIEIAFNQALSRFRDEVSQWAMHVEEQAITDMYKEYGVTPRYECTSQEINVGYRAQKIAETFEALSEVIPVDTSETVLKDLLDTYSTEEVRLEKTVYSGGREEIRARGKSGRYVSMGGKAIKIKHK